MRIFLPLHYLLKEFLIALYVYLLLFSLHLNCLFNLLCYEIVFNQYFLAMFLNLLRDKTRSTQGRQQ